MDDDRKSAGCRLAITGSRHWTDYAAIWTALLADYRAGYRMLAHGDAQGADQMAAHAAVRIGFGVVPFPVDTTIDGPWPAAGHRRNRRMLITFQPQALRAFRAAGKSNGTDGCIKAAREMGIRIL